MIYHRPVSDRLRNFLTLAVRRNDFSNRVLIRDITVLTSPTPSPPPMFPQRTFGFMSSYCGIILDTLLENLTDAVNSKLNVDTFLTISLF